MSFQRAKKSSRSYNFMCEVENDGEKSSALSSLNSIEIFAFTNYSLVCILRSTRSDRSEESKRVCICA